MRSGTKIPWRIAPGETLRVPSRQQLHALIQLANALLAGKIVKGKNGIFISDQNLILSVEDTLSSGSTTAALNSFHPFKAYLVPEEDCIDQSTFGYAVQVRAGLVAFRSLYYVASTFFNGVLDSGPMTDISDIPVWPVTDGADGIVIGSGDYDSTDTTAAGTAIDVMNTGDFTNSGSAQFIFRTDTDGDSNDLAAIFLQIVEGDDVTAPTFAITARHYAHAAGGTGRTAQPWPTDNVIPIALISFANGTAQVENLIFDHAIERDETLTTGLSFRGDWDALQYFYPGDVVFHELTLGDYKYHHWRAIVGNRNVEPVDVSLTTWYPLDPMYIPP